ncbi:MAG: hypothetical protein JSW00_06855 [Thermoplasmata archaeon]|nr:MAG: hypothetical protein JSW00_06855 [Thermoplasmata archaeon]
MKKSNNIIKNDKKKILYKEYKFNYGSLINNILPILLIFFIASIIIFFVTLNIFILIPIIYLYIFIIILFLSNKVIYLTIYEDGINFPQVFLNRLKKEKFLHLNEIIQISVDDINRSLVIKLKSGKEYNYNNSSYFKTDHIYAIIKEVFQKYKHIEFIEPKN